MSNSARTTYSIILAIVCGSLSYARRCTRVHEAEIFTHRIGSLTSAWFGDEQLWAMADDSDLLAALARSIEGNTAAPGSDDEDVALREALELSMTERGEGGDGKGGEESGAGAGVVRSGGAALPTNEEGKSTGDDEGVNGEEDEDAEALRQALQLSTSAFANGSGPVNNSGAASGEGAGAAEEEQVTPPRAPRGSRGRHGGGSGSKSTPNSAEQKAAEKRHKKTLTLRHERMVVLVAVSH